MFCFGVYIDFSVLKFEVIFCCFLWVEISLWFFRRMLGKWIRRDLRFFCVFFSGFRFCSGVVGVRCLRCKWLGVGR